MSKAPYDGADLVKLRKAATKLAKEGELPPRINMSLPDKRNKIPVFENTKDPEFDLNGFSEYCKLKRAVHSSTSNRAEFTLIWVLIITNRILKDPCQYFALDLITLEIKLLIPILMG